MANAFRGEVALSYAGESYTMVMDFNALCDFEGETGKNALQCLEDMEAGNLSVTEMRALMWAGLRQHHPEVDLPLAGSILSANVDAIQRASAAALPEAKPGKPARPRNRAPST